MMAQHEFLTYQEAVDRLGAPETVRQAILTQDLQAYVELNADTTCEYDTDDQGLPNDGQTRFSSWRRSSRWHDTSDPDNAYPDPDDHIETVYYTLTGWFLLSPPTARAVARNRDIKAQLSLLLFPAQDDASEGVLTPEQFEVELHAQLVTLWFRKVDIDSMSSATPTAEHSGAKTLGTRERNSYLRVILALAEMAELGEDLPTATGKVENKLEFLGLHEAGPKNTIIRKILTAAFALKPPPPKPSK